MPWVHVLLQTHSFNQQTKWLHRGKRLECVEKKIFHTMLNICSFFHSHRHFVHGLMLIIRYIRSTTMFSKHHSHILIICIKYQLFKHSKRFQTLVFSYSFSSTCWFFFQGKYFEYFFSQHFDKIKNTEWWYGEENTNADHNI